MSSTFWPACIGTMTLREFVEATKCISKTHGYETTSRAVDVSLQRLDTSMCLGNLMTK